MTQFTRYGVKNRAQSITQYINKQGKNINIGLYIFSVVT